MLSCRKESSSSSRLAFASPSCTAHQMAREMGMCETSLCGEVRGWPIGESRWHKPGSNSHWSPLSKRHLRDAVVCSCLGSCRDAIASKEIPAGGKARVVPVLGSAVGMWL